MLFILAPLLLLYCACESVVNPSEEITFEGITETSLDPTPIGSVDPDDWRPVEECPPHDSGSAETPSCTILFPAYPNPTHGIFHVRFGLAQSDSVAIFVQDKPGHTILTLVHQTLYAGIYTIQISLTGKPEGIYRIYFIRFRADNTAMSYGDLRLAEHL